KLQKIGASGGAWKFSCKFCGETRQGSYLRVKAHLLGIKGNAQLEPLRSTWKEKGVSIVSDGWSDPTRKPLINFMATSGNDLLFLNSVNCFGEVKDRFFIANLMKEVINEIGHQNVVQIITNNAANCKAAGQLIESQFPHIYWTPCVVHTLNLIGHHVLFIRLILL
ncbi:hAT dimerization domain, ribonuclease H-like domain protein, partial [Tanacetum coccineum]